MPRTGPRGGYGGRRKRPVKSSPKNKKPRISGGPKPSMKRRPHRAWTTRRKIKPFDPQ